MLLIGLALGADDVAFDESIKARPIDEPPTPVVARQGDHSRDDVARADVGVNGAVRKAALFARPLDREPLGCDVLVWFHQNSGAVAWRVESIRTRPPRRPAACGHLDLLPRQGCPIAGVDDQARPRAGVDSYSPTRRRLKCG